MYLELCSIWLCLKAESLRFLLGACIMWNIGLVEVPDWAKIVPVAAWIGLVMNLGAEVVRTVLEGLKIVLPWFCCPTKLE